MISIIVPVYRVEPYLHQCIDSILNQTYRNIEILLIDDGSPDRCGEICEDYSEKDERVRVFHTENRGLAAARNLGINRSRGEYIGFVDSDDWIEPDMYETLIQTMKGTGAEICECGLWDEYNDHSVLHISPKIQHQSQVVFNKNDTLIALAEEMITNPTWNKLYHRAVFENISFPEGKNYEDIAVMHWIMEKVEKYVLIAKPEYHYRQRNQSISQTRNAKNLIDCADAYLNRYKFYQENHPYLFMQNKEAILQIAALGISRVWRWWYGCNKEDKASYHKTIWQLKQFSDENIPFWGFQSWPVHLRLSMAFSKYDCNVSFAVLYGLNQLYRRISLGEADG